MDGWRRELTDKRNVDGPLGQRAQWERLRPKCALPQQQELGLPPAVKRVPPAHDLGDDGVNFSQQRGPLHGWVSHPRRGVAQFAFGQYPSTVSHVLRRRLVVLFQVGKRCVHQDARNLVRAQIQVAMDCCLIIRVHHYESLVPEALFQVIQELVLRCYDDVGLWDVLALLLGLVLHNLVVRPTLVSQIRCNSSKNCCVSHSIVTVQVPTKREFSSAAVGPECR
mmetsp:Transcript_18605/g.44471  ORF Transcript_18605/g.44471 Transcript_18605/m.44471 type:complete len:223 (+) Transcript_18605:2-670(+)